MVTFFCVSIIFVLSITPTVHSEDSQKRSTSQYPPILLQRIFDDFITPYSSSWVSQTRTFLTKLRPDFSFDDIDYTSGLQAGRAVWQAANHLDRAAIMTQAYISPQSPMHLNESLWDSTIGVIRYWFKHDYDNEGCTNYDSRKCPANTPGFWNPNWWWNMIGVPLVMGKIGILLNTHFDSDDITHATKILSRANYSGWTAANVVWMATIQVYNGILKKNDKIISDSFSAAFSTVTITPSGADGIKQDGTFFQHNRVLYNGGYGNDFFDDILELVYISAGTSYAPDDSQKAAFSTLLLDGTQYTVIYDTRVLWDISVKGREITRDSVMYANLNGTRLVESTKTWPRASEFSECAARFGSPKTTPPLIANKKLWYSDYMSHHRQNFTVSVKMVSNKTRTSECVNLENLLGLHLSDGALYTYMTGHEYDLIFPTWDWDKIPGITVDYGASPLGCSNTNYLGIKDFVGGTSDGMNGISAMEFLSPHTRNLYFKKSWFFFDNVVIVLVTNVTCFSKAPVYHVLDSRLLDGNVVIPNGTVPKGNSSFTVPWMHHNSIGYIFPTTVKVFTEIATKTANWKSIGVVNANVTKTLFTSWIVGKNPPVISDSLWYMMVPGISLGDFSSQFSRIQSSIKLISNTPELQAISDLSHNFFGAVFWVAGQANFSSNFFVGVSKPCVVLVKFGNDGSQDISISDPTQTLSEVTVTIPGAFDCESSPSSYCYNSLSKESTAIKINFPSGNFAGDSVNTHLTAVLPFGFPINLDI